MHSAISIHLHADIPWDPGRAWMAGFIHSSHFSLKLIIMQGSILKGRNQGEQRSSLQIYGGELLHCKSRRGRETEDIWLLEITSYPVTPYQFFSQAVTAVSSHIFYLTCVVPWIFCGLLGEEKKVASCKQGFPSLPPPHPTSGIALSPDHSTGGEEGFCKCHQHFNQQEWSGERQSGGVDSAPCFWLDTFCACTTNLFFFTFLPATCGY